MNAAGKYFVCAFLLPVISIFIPASSRSQNISGVINTYIEVTNVNNNQAAVDVVSTAGINIHDSLIIIQMQGANRNTSNVDSVNGKITSYNGAGSWELVEVCDIAGNKIYFKKKFKHNYDEDGHVQLIPVNSYNNAVITADITCPAWDGTTGGVVVLFNNGVLDFQAGINVAGKGFRKGVHFESTYSCSWFTQHSNFDYDVTTGLGAHKGEGVVEPANNNQEAGRGPLGNGGGGGNDHNSGGGGGGNIAPGGIGGENRDPGGFNCHGYYPGIGGRGLSSNNERLFMGGGGGAGHSNSAVVWATDGGDGGGIVILVSDRINGNGNAINAYGTNALQAHGDGAGGGGAGGSVLILCDTVTTTITVDVHGGNGGDMDASVAANTDRCFGPGGGGAGGLFRTSSTFVPVNISTVLYGGNQGIVVLSTAACNGDTIGAMKGGYGTVEFNGEIESGIFCSKYCDKVPNINLGGYVYTCGNGYITLDATNTGCTYLWSTGATTATISVNNTDTIWATADNGYCIATDTVRVDNFDDPDAPASNSFIVCRGEFANLDAGNPGCTYLWNTGDTTQVLSVNRGGTYSVTIQNAYCSTSATFEVETCFVPPNTITPNSDGNNDTWIIEYIQEYDGNKIEIFNRRGQLIYSVVNYQNDWDAEGLSDGVYYYVIDLGKGTEKIKGTITVVREK